MSAREARVEAQRDGAISGDRRIREQDVFREAVQPTRALEICDRLRDRVLRAGDDQAALDLAAFGALERGAADLFPALRELGFALLGPGIVTWLRDERVLRGWRWRWRRGGRGQRGWCRGGLFGRRWRGDRRWSGV